MTAMPVEPADRAVRSFANEGEPVYLFWPVLMAYLRVTTQPGLFPQPFTLEEALRNVQALFALRRVRVVSEQPDFLDALSSVGLAADAIGKLVHDAHIVALMQLYQVRTIWTYDRDFRRFDGIRVVEP
jgi:toxin-antitoxin system PIN domain toxin